MLSITSTANDRIKYARLLRTQPKFRSGRRQCIAEGLRLCADAAAGGRVCYAFCTEEFLAANPDFGGDFEIIQINREVADALTDTQTPQGVFCVCSTEGMLRDAEGIRGGRYLLAENISDPGNLGTMIRTAEAFSASGIIISGCCDVFSPKVLRASMGGVFRLPVFLAAGAPELARRLTAAGLGCYAAVVRPEAEAVQSVRPADNFVLAIGSEARGITPELEAACAPVTIPMSGGAESLNAAAAASILLWEFFGRGRA